MPTLDQLERALRAADEAGDSEAATALATAYREASAQPSSIGGRLWEGVKGGAARLRDEVFPPGNPVHALSLGTVGSDDVAGRKADLAAYEARRGQLGIPGAIGDALPELVASAVPIARVGSKLPLAMKALGRAAPLVGDVAANAGYEGGKALLSGGDVARDTAMGAGGAVAGRAFAKSLGALANRATTGMTPEARALLEAGVTPTPGQAFGGATGMAENALKVVPGLGSAIERGQARAGRQYATAEVNRALAPLGEQIDEEGLKAVARANEIIGKSYDDLVGRTFWEPDAARTGVQRAAVEIQKIPGLNEQQYNHVLDFINRRIQPAAVEAKQASSNIPGRVAKDIDADLGTLARKFSNAPDPMHHALGDAYRTLQMHMRDVLGASDDTARAQLRATNEAYRNMIPVAKAADRAGGQKGVFSPNQFRSAANGGGGALDLSAGPLNDAATQVIDPAGSGRLARSVIGSAGTLAHPAALAGIAAGSAIGHTLYSERGVKLMLSAMNLPANTRRWVENLPSDKQAEFIARMLDEVPSYKQLAAQVARHVAVEGAHQ